MLEGKYAYIDECGNTNLETRLVNVSTHYVITAIVVDAEEVERVKQAFENARSSEFQSGEMKSSKIRKDDRRARILGRLAGLDFVVKGTGRRKPWGCGHRQGWQCRRQWRQDIG